jgi:hypothetical protein
MLRSSLPPQPDWPQSPTSSRELDTSLPVLHRDRVHPCRIGARLQRCACIGSIRTRLLFICRSPFVRPSHSPARTLPSLRISNRRSAPPPPFTPSVRLHSTFALQLAGRFAGSANRRTDSEFSSLFLAQLRLAPWLLRLAAGRVGRHRRLVRAGPSKRPQPNRSGNRTRTPTSSCWDACRYVAHHLADYAARRCRSARPCCDLSQMKTIGCALSGLWCGLEPSSSRSLLSGIAAMLVVMLALVRSTLWRGLMLYVPRLALRASAVPSKVRWDTPLAATGRVPCEYHLGYAVSRHGARLHRDAQRSMQGTLIRTRCGYLEFHPWGAMSTHLGEIRRACE